MQMFKIAVPWSLSNLKNVRNMINGFIDELIANPEPEGVIQYPGVTDQQTEAAPPAPPEQTEQTEQTAPPAPPEQTAPPALGNVELDTNGIPWDKRIHASTKTKNADGSWRNMRGVDKDLLAQVEAELKAVSNDTPAGPPADQGTAPTGPGAPPADQDTTFTGPTAHPDQSTPVVKDYMYVVQRISSVDPQKLQEALTKNGLSALPELFSRPELAPIICNELGI